MTFCDGIVLSSHIVTFYDDSICCHIWSVNASLNVQTITNAEYVPRLTLAIMMISSRHVYMGGSTGYAPAYLRSQEVLYTVYSIYVFLEKRKKEKTYLDNAGPAPIAAHDRGLAATARFPSV